MAMSVWQKLRIKNMNHDLPTHLDNNEKMKSYNNCFPCGSIGPKIQVGKDPNCTINKSGIRLRDMDHPKRYSDSEEKSKKDQSKQKVKTKG